MLGWTIASATPDRVVLEAPSPLMTTRNIVHLDAARVYRTTEVTCTRFPARPLWALAAPVHELVIPARLRLSSAAGMACPAPKFRLRAVLGKPLGHRWPRGDQV
ncbi:hypothetical protein CU254_17700 [Amycolatopsis sp. AA4]|nr:hypothetical protein CU254_17700 [Amycolatopsis sp. AA4]EFL07804.1 hypothetical protein SSMG_03475 [Streptomyces sp. AA4]